MNKIVAVFEAPGFTSQDYNAIVEELKAQGKFPNDECPSHVAFQKDKNWCVVDVWNSEEAFMDFGKNSLVPIFQKLGITPIQPQVYALHNFYVAAEVPTSA